MSNETPVNLDELSFSFLQESLKFDHSSESFSEALRVDYESRNSIILSTVKQYTALISKDSSNNFNFSIYLDILMGNCSSLEEALIMLSQSGIIWVKNFLAVANSGNFNVFTYIALTEKEQLEQLTVLRATEIGFMDLRVIENSSDDEDDIGLSFAQMFKIQKSRYDSLLERLLKGTEYYEKNIMESDKSRSQFFAFWLSQARNLKELYFIAAFFGVCNDFVGNKGVKAEFNLLTYKPQVEDESD